MRPEKSPLSELERSIVSVVCGASFPPATAAKRFIMRLAGKEIQYLTPRGRWFLAYIAHRFRRQYALTVEQWQWVDANRGSSVEPAEQMERHPAIEFP